MRSHEEDVAELIIEAAARGVRAFRIEIVGVGLLAALWVVTDRAHGSMAAWSAIAIVIAVVVAVGFVPNREALAVAPGQLQRRPMVGARPPCLLDVDPGLPVALRLDVQERVS